MIMNIEIPEFLLEMSRQIKEQDNRCTAEPIYQVRCKRYLITEEGYSESHWELHAEDSDGYPIYSTKPGFNSDHSSSEFYEANEEWCDDWLVDNDLEPCSVEFYTNFCFKQFKESGDEWPEGYRVIHLQETEEVIKTCLTKADADYFIQRKQHDYPKLYTYAGSMVYCPQMIQLRNWILSLTQNQ